MSETFPEDPTLTQVCSNVQLAESLACVSGRGANFPSLSADQEKDCLQLLRDRLTSLQKSVQVGLLDRYIRICDKSSVRYPPLPITGIKACLYIVKVSTGSTDSSVQEKLAIVIENWRLILGQLIGLQIAGSQSIWTSKALCQLCGQAERNTTPSSNSKRKRSPDNDGGAHNNNDSSICFPLAQRCRSSLSNPEPISLSQEITPRLSPGTPLQQKDTSQTRETCQNTTVLQPPNATTGEISSNQAPNTNESSSSNIPRNAENIDATDRSAETGQQPCTTRNPVSTTPMVTSSENEATPQFSCPQHPSTLQQSKISSEPYNASPPSDVRNTLQEPNSLPLISSDENLLNAGQLIHEKLESCASSSTVDSNSPNVSRPAVSRADFSVSLSTLNLLNYWQHTFRLLDLAVTELLEITPLSPPVSLSKASSYYPQAYSPSFQWVPATVPSYAPPPTLECINSAPVLTSQSPYMPCSSIPQPLIIPPPSSSHQSNQDTSGINSDRKLSNASTAFSMHAKLPTPVSPKQRSVQSTPPERPLLCPSTIQHPVQNLKNPGKQFTQCLENTPNSRQSSQQSEEALNPKQSPSNTFNPTVCSEEPEIIILDPTGLNIDSTNVCVNPIEFVQEPPQIHPTASQCSQQPENPLGTMQPSQPSQKQQLENNLPPHQLIQQSQKPSQQLEKISLSRQLVQQSVANPAQFVFKITEAQKIKFVNTYRRVDATGKAKLEATLRQNKLWDQLSPLLSTSITDTTDSHDFPNSTLNSTVEQQSKSPSPLVVSLVPSESPIETVTPDKLHVPEIALPSQSAAPPRGTSKCAAPKTQIPFDPTSLNARGLSESLLDPILSKMIIAMLAPGPQANTVLMAAFDTLGIRNNDAIITHLKALADCYPGGDDTFWKLRSPVEEATPAESSLSTHQAKSTPLNILDKTNQEIELAVPPVVATTDLPPTTHQSKSSATPRELSATSQILNEAQDSSLKADLSGSNHIQQIQILNDFTKEDVKELIKTDVEATDEQCEVNQNEDEIDGASLSTPSKLNSIHSKVSPKILKTKAVSTHNRLFVNLPPRKSKLNFNVYQDDLPGFPDVDPSIQIQGTPSRILARYDADQQMPPIRTFVPLLRKPRS